jgi:uncharacterized protein
MSTPGGIRGPVRSGERAPAPDLARGFMLLLICIANTPWYLMGRRYLDYTIHPPEGTLLDRIAQFAIITAVDARIYPMFAFLFGYGMVQLLLRQQAAGASESAARSLLQRRNLWLLAFGFAHALLLFMGDILGGYAVAGLLLVWLFLRRSDGTILLWAGLLTALLALMAVFQVFGALLGGAAAAESFSFFEKGTASIREPHLLFAALWRLATWPFVVVFQGLLGLVTPIAILLGFWAARHRVLEEPEHHLPLLRRTAAIGIAVGWLGALPLASFHVGVLPVTEVAGTALSGLTSVTGLAGGLGYAALFGLIGHRLRTRGRSLGPAGTMVAAVGRRSLSCYLAQSLLCAPLLAAWGLGWGSVLHNASMLAFAVGVWVVIALGAYALERAGRRGPAEVLLRRLVYGRAAANRPDSGR